MCLNVSLQSPVRVPMVDRAKKSATTTRVSACLGSQEEIVKPVSDQTLNYFTYQIPKSSLQKSSGQITEWWFLHGIDLDCLLIVELDRNNEISNSRCAENIFTFSLEQVLQSNSNYTCQISMSARPSPCVGIRNMYGRNPCLHINYFSLWFMIS